MVKLCTLALFRKTVEKKTAHSIVRIYCFNNRVTYLLYFKHRLVNKICRLCAFPCDPPRSMRNDMGLKYFLLISCNRSSQQVIRVKHSNNFITLSPNTQGKESLSEYSMKLMKPPQLRGSKLVYCPERSITHKHEILYQFIRNMHPI